MTRGVLLALLSGLLLALAFTTERTSLLVWVGLIPLFVALRAVGPVKAMGLGWLAGTVYFFAILWWVAVPLAVHTTLPAFAAVALVVLLAAVAALQVGLFAGVTRLHDAWLGRPGVAFAAALWTVLEWVRTAGPFSFPPGSLAYALDPAGPVLQLAEYTGIYGPGALIVATNAALAGLVVDRDDRWWRWASLAVVATALLLATFVGEDLRRRAEQAEREPVGTVRIELVQSVIFPDPARSREEQSAILARLERLTRTVDVEGMHLVIWPEGAFPAPFVDDETLHPAPSLLGPAGPLRDRLESFVHELGVPLLFGASAVDVRKTGSGEVWNSFNRVLLVSRLGRVRHHYDKMQLVPFGERIPFPRLSSVLDPVVPTIGKMVPGEDRTVFRIPRGNFRVLICYEAIFPGFVRRHARGVDFLVNLTNDVWFGNTAGLQLHFRMAAVRAIETRRPLLRVANGGISGLVEPSGIVGPTIPPFVEGARIVEIPRRDRPLTFYLRYGDVFVLLSGLAAGALLVYVRGRSRFIAT